MTYDEWVKTECQPAYRPINGHENRIMRVAFTAARRMTREECVRICNRLAGDTSNDGYDCANAIRSTIPEVT